MRVFLQPCWGLQKLLHLQNIAETDANENNTQKHF